MSALFLACKNATFWNKDILFQMRLVIIKIPEMIIFRDINQLKLNNKVMIYHTLNYKIVTSTLTFVI